MEGAPFHIVARQANFALYSNGDERTASMASNDVTKKAGTAKRSGEPYFQRAYEAVASDIAALFQAKYEIGWQVTRPNATSRLSLAGMVEFARTAVFMLSANRNWSILPKRVSVRLEILVPGLSSSWK